MRRSPPHTPQESSTRSEPVPHPRDVGSLIHGLYATRAAGAGYFCGGRAIRRVLPYSCPRPMPRPLVRDSVRVLDCDVPGEQPGPESRVVKLNTNENPYPPSPRVMDAIRSLPPHALQSCPPPMADP